MKKKIITLILAALSALSALSLAACRTGGNTPAGSTGTVGTKGTDGDVTYDANNILDKFDGKDFGGKDFTYTARITSTTQSLSVRLRQRMPTRLTG